MPSVVIGGNKVTIKKPLIATRYSLIVNELNVSVVEVTLILRRAIRFSSERCKEMRRKVLARDNWEVRFVTCPIARMPSNLRIERLVRTPF